MKTKYSYKQIWTITFPILISLIMEQMIGMTDTAFLGRVGEIELGASAIAGVYYLAIFMMAFGFSIGAQILIARRNGETGLRLGEILGIHYTEDIDFERRTVRVRYRESNTNLARAKNAEYRMALLSNTTFEFLVKYISDNRKSLMNSEYLFTKLTGKNKGEPLDADSVYSMLKRLSKKTDINSHPHQLRHYFAEERRKEGWDLNDIRFALGHKKVETTIKYLGENNERLIEATDQYYSNNEDLYQIADFL